MAKKSVEAGITSERLSVRICATGVVCASTGTTQKAWAKKSGVNEGDTNRSIEVSREAELTDIRSGRGLCAS